MKLLLNRVTALIERDGRRPSTVKLTVRKVFHQQDNSKRNVRESRQTSMDFGLSTAESQLKIVNLLMSLFDKIIVNGEAWQVTLLGISFSGFLAAVDDKNSLRKYFGSSEPPAKRSRLDESPAQSTTQLVIDHAVPASSSSTLTCPKGIDSSVFYQLPRDIQLELISSSTSESPRPPTQKKVSPPSDKTRNLLHYFRKPQ